jgi:hypothetical protein
MRYTKKQITDAFLLYLDDSLPSFECKQIKEHGNYNCEFRCDLCMIKQYLKRAKNGDMPRVYHENNGRDYPLHQPTVLWKEN